MNRISRKRLAAAAASGVIAWGLAPSPTSAGIVNPVGHGSVTVFGTVAQGPPPFPTVQKEYNDASPQPSGIDPVHATRSGHTELSNASAASSASQDTVITFNPANDFLQLTSSNSVTADTHVDPPTQTLVGVANASAQSQNLFHFNLTDHNYDYVITLGDFVLNKPGPASQGFEQVNLTLNKGSPFEQDLFAQELLTDGSTRHAGSLAGTLAPGDYTFFIDLVGSVTQRSGHTDGTLGAGLLLKAAPPEIKWANAVSGSFQTATNWDPQRVPGSPERAAFDVPGTYTVTLDQDTTNDRLRANGAGVNVNFDLAGHNYTVDQFNIGGKPGDSGRFTIKDSGGISVSAASSGGPRPAQFTPPMTFKAASMSVRSAETLEIAAATTSDSAIVEGVVKASGSAAQWTAQLLLVGSVDGGEVTVSNKAGLVTHSAESGGDGAGGAVTVTGAGTVWTCDHLQVQGSGQGLVNVASGGSLFVLDLGIGTAFETSGIVVVDGASALFQTGAEAVVGNRGTGSLKVRNGAVYGGPNGTLTIGKDSSGNGDVAITGGGSVLVAGLNVGTGGTGVLTLNDRATVSVSPVGVPGGTVVGSRGQVAVNANSTFVSDQLLQVDGIFRVDPATGQAIVGDDPGTFGRGKLFVSTNGTLSGTGTIFGHLVLAGGTDAFTGHVLPGNSPGTLTIAGDFEQQPGGVLDIQIAGTAPGRFDVLAITGDPDAGIVGNATIGGDLSLQFLDGFAPRRGDRFDFLTATGALTGQFQHVQVLNLAPGFQFDLRQEDGHYALVALNDGVAVPEPAAAALLILSCLALTRRRRRDRDQL